MRSQEEIAREIAIAAHEGQVDKAGKPYIEHPAAVASMVEGDECKAVAWLHDVVEDTDFTLDDLRSKGVCDAVLEAVGLMTHRDGIPYFDYVRDLKRNPLAKAVKLADLTHNSDLSRLSAVTEQDLERREKYLKAKAILLEE